jgi:hypothetical protein
MTMRHMSHMTMATASEVCVVLFKPRITMAIGPQNFPFKTGSA